MRLFPSLSFRQLLVLAFLLIAVLLGAASLHGLHTLETLVTQSREGLTRAVQLNADVQLLAERRVTMERAARQYLVLGDPALRQRFNDAAHEASAALGRLHSSLPSSFPAAEWPLQVQTIATQLDAPAVQMHYRDAALTAAFRRIDWLNVSAAEQVRLTIKQQNENMLDQLEQGRLLLGRQLLAAIVAAVLLALALGYWLGRPVQRLERAIDGLGENRLEQPIEIDGPSDLRSLGRRLDWLRLRLSEVEADKTRFLRHISHELKTPLAALREGASLLEEGVAGPLTPRQAEVVRILRQHTLTLQGQIEDLLRFNAAAFEARTLSPRPAELSALVAEVVAAQRLQWESRQLQVNSKGGPLMAEVDPLKFATVIGNLLSNAIRFSPSGASIAITLQRLSDRAVLEIVDAGPGVAEEDRGRVFEPFYRGRHQPDHGLRGSGIGLSIVHEYVVAHGGRIALMPSAAGARFRIELPYAPDS
ncbi:MAG: sensor histidine kinase [Moraxellaceae bacterium]